MVATLSLRRPGSALNQRQKLLVLGLALMSFPNVSVSGLPVPISGIEISFLYFACLLALAPRAARAAFAGMPAALKVVAMLPVLLILSSFVGGLAQTASEIPWYYQISFQESFLQSARRISVVALIVAMFMLIRTRADLRLVWVTLAVGVIGGSVLYAMVREGMVPALEIKSSLTGNYAQEFVGEIDLIVLSKRFAGTTGSPTTFAAYIAGIIFLGWRLAQRGIVSTRAAAGFGLIGTILMLMTASKSIIAAYFGLLPLLGMHQLRFRRVFLWAYSGLIGIVVLFATGFIPLAIFDPLVAIAARVQHGGWTSFLSRFYRWDLAFDLMNSAPAVAVFGHGWQAKAVGYHNEFLEVLMGFGLLMAPFIYAVMFVLIPRLMALPDGGPQNMARAYYVVLLFASLFQAIFLNVFILSILAIWYAVNVTLWHTRHEAQS